MNDFQNNTGNEIIDYSPAEENNQPQGGKVRIILGFLITWGILGYGFYEINNLNNQKDNSRFAKRTKTEIQTINKQNTKTDKQLSLNTKSIDVLLSSLAKLEDKQRELALFSPSKTNTSKINTNKDTTLNLQEELNKLQEDTSNFKKDLLETLKTIQINLDNSITSNAKKLEEQSTKQISLSNSKILSNNKQLVKLTSSIKEIIDDKNQNNFFNSTTYTLLKLRNRIDNAKNYNIELDILEKLTQENPEISKYLTELKNILAKNNDTTKTLKNSFIKLTNQIKENVGKEKIENEDGDSFWGSVKSSISSQISVEKLAANKEEVARINIVVQKTLSSFESGDLNSAIKDSGKFNSTETEILNKWRESLKSLYRREQLFDKIYSLSNQDNNSTKKHSLPM